MTKEDLLPAAPSETTDSPSKTGVKRRSFLKAMGGTGAALSTGSLLTATAEASQRSSDVAILRFLAAAELLETDLWQQYNEVGGIPDSEVPGGRGNRRYTNAIKKLDGDMDQYIHDNTEDEMTHELEAAADFD